MASGHSEHEGVKGHLDVTNKMIDNAEDKQGGRVALVVDDDRTIRRVATLLLKGYGFSCMTATNGEEGLDAMKTSTFDIVLCDIDMPKMTGLETIQQLREWEKGASKDSKQLRLLCHRRGCAVEGLHNCCWL